MCGVGIGRVNKKSSSSGEGERLLTSLTHTTTTRMTNRLIGKAKERERGKSLPNRKARCPPTHMAGLIAKGGG